ncbi:hypothetical protein Pcinc_043641 [Petrolisthes cinctipes]|uniref:Fe2OG dioxygenase domain-containing protein n=1 Tax=Petrolisthes cinctipes TaxID=88211 RepID=A0AAE1EHN7_PETCI|nr:hypothetical protein Pcinc_043641 [Petrolisthes cinctipes]
MYLISDIEKPEEPSQKEWQRVGKEIYKAFSDIGFVYLTNHGIPRWKTGFRQVDEINQLSGKFFELERSKKMKYQRVKHISQGYTAPNQERLSDNKRAMEIRESYDIQTVDAMMPDEEVAQLRPRVKVLVEDCCRLTTRFLTAMAVGLEMDPSYFVDCHQELCTFNNATAMRLLYYPPVSSDTPPASTRTAPHTDYGTITFLFQDDIGGLEVRDRDNAWVSASPLPDTILVNVGDILQFWTADKFPATEHRVLIPEEELKRKVVRRSLVFFIHPDDPTVIKPLDGSTTYSPITARQHVNNRFDETFQL